jgi:WD40 repeat protein
MMACSSSGTCQGNAVSLPKSQSICNRNTTYSAQPKLEIQAHAEWIADVRYSPDAAVLATASGDGSVRLWDAETYELLLDYCSFETLLTYISFADLTFAHLLL